MLFLSVLAKVFSKVARCLGRGGETWPGELALRLNPQLGLDLKKRFSRVILVAGTNGKTSTAKFLSEALIKHGETVITNRTGANLLNGLVSSALVQLPLFAKTKKPVAVFEVDEYALPEVALFFRPEAILFLNVFRDQLDRYGEVNNILRRWLSGLQLLKSTKLVYLASDPALYYAFKSLSNPKLSFTIPKNLLSKTERGVLGDFMYCPVCSGRLKYSGYYLGHLGNWECPNCHTRVPKPEYVPKSTSSAFKKLPAYQQVNLLGVYTLLRSLNYPEEIFEKTLVNWHPAFGRGEVFKQGLKEYVFYLGKNPASWTAALTEIDRNITEKDVLVFGLNNRVPDGHDVSWIYDADFGKNLADKKLVIFGDRAYDLGVRLKLAGYKTTQIFPDIVELVRYFKQESTKRIIILANYSALLEARKTLTGRAVI